MNENLNNTPFQFNNGPPPNKAKLQLVLFGIAGIVILVLVGISFVFGFLPILLVLIIAGLLGSLVSAIARKRQKPPSQSQREKPRNHQRFDHDDVIDVDYQPVDDDE